MNFKLSNCLFLLINLLYNSDPPSAPQGLQIIDIHKKSAVLTWKPPADDGGTPVTNYRIEYKQEGGMRWDLANEGEKVTNYKYTVTGLREGQM